MERVLPPCLIHFGRDATLKVLPLCDLMLIGRAHCAHIRVRDPTVSYLHCCLCRTRPEAGTRTPPWEVYDLGSRNGTFLNGRPIKGPTPLHHGDCIELGPFHALRVVLASVPSAGGRRGSGWS